MERRRAFFWYSLMTVFAIGSIVASTFDYLSSSAKEKILNPPWSARFQMGVTITIILLSLVIWLRLLYSLKTKQHFNYNTHKAMFAIQQLAIIVSFSVLILSNYISLREKSEDSKDFIGTH
jgi:hypothetical protein